jgi:DNA polymerase-3 subunit epsilon
MFAIIDIETTGGSYKYERIIEIAIVIHDGQKVIETFDSLVNPEMLIPHHITRLTGISNEMVDNAPRFFEIAKTVVEMTEGKVFVAHNVNFDYGFIRKEFSDLGYNYSRRKLCTVKYTRQVFPGLPSYGLGKLSSHFGISNDARHRALGDAKATAELLSKIIEKDQWNLFKQSLRKNDVLSDMHAHLSSEKLKLLPQKPGVYFFYDNNDQLIYIGKSVNIHNRIIAHLNNDSSARYLEMRNRIADIKYELTGCDLMAQLRESDLIKKHKPFYNRVLKRDGFKFGLYTNYDTHGYLGFEIKKGKIHSEALLTFNNQQQARNYISRIGAEYGICYPDNNLHKGDSCLKYLNGQCLGACIGKVDIDEYNDTFRDVLSSLMFEEGEFIVQLEGRTDTEIGFILVKDRKYRGYGFAPRSLETFTYEEILPYLIKSDYNYDNHLIVRSYLLHEETVKIHL